PACAGTSGAWCGLCRLRKLAVECQTALVGGDGDFFAILDGAGQDHFGKRILYRLLDDTLERPRAVSGVPALFSQPLARAWIELDHDLAVVEQLLQSRNLDVDDASHLRLLEAMKEDDFINAVEKLRPECRAHHCHHLILDRVGILSFRLVDQKFGAKI